jgi:hypothetical protein
MTFFSREIVVTRGLTILDSTLTEINTALSTTITKDEIRRWKLRLLRLIPSLREKWVKISKQTHQTALFTTVVHIMNTEVSFSQCPPEDVFHIKQACLLLARDFSQTTKARHIKKPEVWARAICLKALREKVPDHPFPFPHLPSNTEKVIEHKRWQLDQVEGLGNDPEGAVKM